MELSERKKKILASVTERYIMTGEPVGSKVLCDSLTVSSATIRNEMSELSEIGYLEQPHTSAGRIPSQKGLRFYINNLMQSYDINDADRFTVQSRLDNSDGEPHEILSEAAKLLSEMTGCTAVALTPYDRHATIKRIELVPMSLKTVLVVVLMSTGVIKSRICRSDSDIDLETAELFYNIAAAHFVGRSAVEFTVADIQTLAASLGEKALVMTPMLVALTELSDEASRCTVITEGQSNLLNFKELESDVYNIYECMKHAPALASIINKGNENLNILIGRESLHRAFENVSVISSKYSVGGKDVGAVGIIGPLRLDYARIIPNIMYISETVSKVLSEMIDE